MIAALASPIVRVLIAMALGAALLAGVWLHGYRTAVASCEADKLRDELAAAKRDLTISRAAAEDATRRATILDETLQANQERLDDYETALAARPDARCALTGDDLRGVLGRP